MEVELILVSRATRGNKDSGKSGNENEMKRNIRKYK